MASGTSFCLCIGQGSCRCVSRPVPQELQSTFGPPAFCTSTVSAALFDVAGLGWFIVLTTLYSWHICLCRGKSAEASPAVSPQ